MLDHRLPRWPKIKPPLGSGRRLNAVGRISGRMCHIRYSRDNLIRRISSSKLTAGPVRWSVSLPAGQSLSSLSRDEPGKESVQGWFKPDPQCILTSAPDFRFSSPLSMSVQLGWWAIIRIVILVASSSSFLWLSSQKTREVNPMLV